MEGSLGTMCSKTMRLLQKPDALAEASRDLHALAQHPQFSSLVASFLCADGE
jgi:hypothetical protein